MEKVGGDEEKERRDQPGDEDDIDELDDVAGLVFGPGRDDVDLTLGEVAPGPGVALAAGFADHGLDKAGKSFAGF